VSRAINLRQLVSPPFHSLYAPIQQELADAEEILHNQLRSKHADIDEKVRHGCLLGGKRLRPALLLLAAKAVGQVQPEHLTLAAVVEIHTATLIHDDVLDEAQLRRHVKTCNAIWDNEASVLLGDFLFTHSFYLASTLETTYACRTIGDATNTVCEGELRQIANRRNFAISESTYIEIIDAKTAAFCGCACQLGGHYAGASPDVVQSLSRYGRNLGIAFQITDDLLDVVGTEADTGKTLGTDIDKQKPTLPLIHALEQASSTEREAILKSIDHGNKDSNWFEQFGSIGYTRQKAHEFASRARQEADKLMANPAAEVLQLLPECVVSRAV